MGKKERKPTVHLLEHPFHSPRATRARHRDVELVMVRRGGGGCCVCHFLYSLFWYLLSSAVVCVGVYVRGGGRCASAGVLVGVWVWETAWGSFAWSGAQSEFLRE